MRTPTPVHKSHSTPSPMWKWLGGIALFFGILWFGGFFSGESTTETTNNGLLTVTPGSGSQIYQIDKKGGKEIINGAFEYTDSDSSISLTQGSAEFSNDRINGMIDKGTELSYRQSESQNTLQLLRGRSWIEFRNGGKVVLKNFTAEITGNGVVLAEQNQVYSTFYALKSDIIITTTNNISHTLKAGERIMVAQSDIMNPRLSLGSLSGPIDDVIQQNPLFIAKNGDELLKSLRTSSGSITSSGASGSGILSSSLNGSTTSSSSSITFIDPVDGMIVSNPVVTIKGTYGNMAIKKIVVNDQIAKINTGEKSFSLSPYTLKPGSNDIIYKAYDDSGKIVEKGIITVSTKGGTDKLTPTNFPVNNTDFRITSPTENPYITTDGAVTVEGVVPKNTVEYIMVNNYRLKKFSANGTSWYYYANTTYDTMKEGINLYEIKFYAKDDTLLSTQLFTIVKEKKSPLVSGEAQ